MLLRAILAALTALLLVAVQAEADSVKIGALSLTDLWTRATPPNAPTAGGYLTIENTGAEADRLVAVTSPLAGRAMIHQVATKDGTMTMREAKGLEIAPGETIALAPGGFHIMFIGLKDTLVEGGKMPVTVTFERAGSIDTFLQVLSIGARGPRGSDPHDDSEHGAGEHGSGQ